MSCAKLRTNRRIELYENLRLDNEIDELQNHIHNRCRQRLRNRAHER